MDRIEFLRDSFEKFGFRLNDKQTEQFLKYADLLTEWNKKMNLTTITEFEDIVWKHFIDSLAVIHAPNVSRETLAGNMIDVGTGAGFPGIPLKIAFPETRITCLDSLNKRISFLQEVVRQCHLKKIYLYHGRAEEMGHDSKHREKYDVSVSRAVANLATLSEYCLPFVKRGGVFLSYKSGNCSEEVNEGKKAIKVFGGELCSVDQFIIKGSELSRSIVIIKKKENTPAKYPRKAGLPSKRPII